MAYFFDLNIESMRCVTTKPPKMLTLASAVAETGCKHGANDDDGADGVGDGHQRRMQRRCDIPDDVVADEARHQENGEQEDEGLDGMGHVRGNRGLRCGLCLQGERARFIGNPTGLIGYRLRVHGSLVLYAACAGAKDGWMMAPFRVSSVPFTISSFSGREVVFASLSQKVVRNVRRLRAYRLLAATGMRPGQLR